MEPLLRHPAGPSIERLDAGSFVIRRRAVAVVNDGWTAAATHLWFSHEHAELFSPAVLNAVGEPVRRRTKLILQGREDRRIAEHCRRNRIQVLEAPDGDWLDLGSGVRIQVGQVPFQDGWSVVEAGGVRVLTLNDCVLGRRWDLDRMARVVLADGPIDVLLTQCTAGGKLDWLRAQLDAVRPRYCVLSGDSIAFDTREATVVLDSLSAS